MYPGLSRNDYRASDHENYPVNYAVTGNICFAKYTELVVIQSLAKQLGIFAPWCLWGFSTSALTAEECSVWSPVEHRAILQIEAPAAYCTC